MRFTEHEDTGGRTYVGDAHTQCYSWIGQNVTVNELRELLVNLPPDMQVGVAYPDHQNQGIAHQSLDVREWRVSDPFHKFAGQTKEIFVLEVY